MNKRRAVAGLLILLVSVAWTVNGPPIRPARAANGCNTVYPVPDGRVTDTKALYSTADLDVAWDARAGRSYSVEAEDINGPLGQVFNLNNDGTPCPTTDMAGVVNTGNTEPDALSQFQRRSFISLVSQRIHSRIDSGGASAGEPFTVAVSVAETTMFSPRWISGTNKLTLYGFQNTTGNSVQVLLTLRNIVGATGTTTLGPFYIPGDSTVYKNVGPGQDVTPPGTVGSAMLAQDGPPGAIKADAVLVSNGAYIPEDFKPVRETVH